MDRTQFGEALKAHFFPLFPDTAAYILRQPEATREAWAAMFANEEPRDLIAALMRFADGSEELPAYERERFAVILLKLTRQQRAERDRRRLMHENHRESVERRERRSQATAKGSGIGDQIAATMVSLGMGAAFRQVLAIEEQAKRGEISEDVAATRKREILNAIAEGRSDA